MQVLLVIVSSPCWRHCRPWRAWRWPPRRADASSRAGPGRGRACRRRVDVHRLPQRHARSAASRSTLARTPLGLDHHVDRHGLAPPTSPSTALRGEVRRRLAADRAHARSARHEGRAKRSCSTTSFGADHRDQRDHPERRHQLARPIRSRRATVVLPNNFFAGYEALAARLVDADAGRRAPGLHRAAGGDQAPRSRRSATQTLSDAGRRRQDARVSS